MPLDPRQIEREIEAGLPNERDRLGDDYDAYRYSEARFEEYPTKSKDGRQYNAESARRTSPVMRRVMEVLSQNLYKSQPTRKLRDPRASEWLGKAYKGAAMSPKWHRADQLTLVGGFCAFQWKGAADPMAPLSASLWGAHELVVWRDPDDATKPGAIATIERFDAGRRLRLYTPESVVTYETEKGADHVAFGRTAYRETGRRLNYGFKEVKGSRRANTLQDADGKPALPFSFCHWSYPTQEFTTNGPGLGLKGLNESVNERLDRLGDAIHFLGRPVGIASGVDEAWKAPAEIKPGDFISLPPATDAGGNGAPPTLSYLMADTGYVAADWADLNNYLDHVLEMHSVPPVLIRMIQSGARSGASIQAEQLPLLAWIESRRSMWALYEEAAARMALSVGAAHLRANGEARDAAALERELADWQFSVHWPPLYVQLPGPERDAADDWRLQRGLVSKVGILQERYDFTEEEAFEALEKVAEQNARLAASGIDPGTPRAGGFGMQQQLPPGGEAQPEPPYEEGPDAETQADTETETEESPE